MTSWRESPASADQTNEAGTTSRNDRGILYNGHAGLGSNSIVERDLDQPDMAAAKYEHNQTGEDNADAHLKRQIMGREVIVAITNGNLDFGPWEQIFYGEFDGRRNKRVLVKVIGE